MAGQVCIKCQSEFLPPPLLKGGRPRTKCETCSPPRLGTYAKSGETRTAECRECKTVFTPVSSRNNLCSPACKLSAARRYVTDQKARRVKQREDKRNAQERPPITVRVHRADEATDAYILVGTTSLREFTDEVLGRRFLDCVILETAAGEVSHGAADVGDDGREDVPPVEGVVPRGPEDVAG